MKIFVMALFFTAALLFAGCSAPQDEVVYPAGYGPSVQATPQATTQFVSSGGLQVRAFIPEDVKALLYPGLIYFASSNPDLVGPDTGLVTFEVVSDKPLSSVRFSVEVPEYTGSEYVKTISLPAGATKLNLLPAFNDKVFNNAKDSPMQVNAKVMVDGKAVYEESFTVKLRDYHLISWTTPSGLIQNCSIVINDTCFESSFVVATLVTPNDPEVTKLVSEAAEYLTTWDAYGNAVRLGFNGYQGSQLPQVSQGDWENLQATAVWQAMSARKLKYINAPLLIPEQYVKLPAETLQAAGGNCIELSLLLASALSKIGFRTYIILSPTFGHAIMCYDNAGNQNIVCLDGTTIGAGSAQQSLQLADQQGQELMKKDKNLITISVERASQLGLKNWRS